MKDKWDYLIIKNIIKIKYRVICLEIDKLSLPESSYGCAITNLAIAVSELKIELLKILIFNNIANKL